ncbi:FUSC family protein [Streptomyces diastatochromogenes]|uniref:FUSC family protein n=1 Tax=Streptomyces diastatochromogenes TaxID=42236 RepID=UPI00365648A8
MGAPGTTPTKPFGTVIGVAAMGAAALLADASAYALVGTVAVFGALMAVWVRRHYAVATTGLTKNAFLVDLLGGRRPLYGPRILDTILAAAVVLVANVLVWPEYARQLGLRPRAETALRAVRRYRDVAQRPPSVRRCAARPTTA